MHLVLDSGFFLLFSEPSPPILLTGLSKKKFQKSHSPALDMKNF